MPDELKAEWAEAEELGQPDKLLRDDNDFVDRVAASVVSSKHYISFEVGGCHSSRLPDSAGRMPGGQQPLAEECSVG
jgi:hypothetical protein